MNPQRLKEIEARLENALPAPEVEPTFRDEAWIMRHLEEVITAYRIDVPALVKEVKHCWRRIAYLEEMIDNGEEF